MIQIEKMTILVVDDMKSMRLTIRKMLQHLKIGKALKFAENGKEGLEILHNSVCDLAIIDWNMPVMNGSEMLEQIRSDKNLRDMPVIMVTAEAERDIVSEVAENEIDAYLLKPLTLASLDDKIKAVIEKVNNPEPATVHRLKARDSEEQGQYDIAIEQIKEALTHRPSASRLLRQLGLLHFKIGKESTGVRCLLKAASVNKQDTITRAHLAAYYTGKKNFERAGQYYLQILSLSDKYMTPAIKLAEKLLKTGSRKLALDIFSKVISRSKKNTAARENIIEICLENEELEFPKALLAKSIKENPSNYDLVFKAGMVNQESGDWEKALEYFIDVDRHVRGHMEAKLQIAKIYFMNRKVLQADEYLNQILNLDPDNKDALELRREI